MRDYAQVIPRFWTGDTGKQIRLSGRDVQVLALYLMTCPSSNMIGLYYLPLPTLCHETGMDVEGASKALRRVKEINFAVYSDSEEVVFVPEMARYQIGEKLEPKDNRIKGVAREVIQYRKSIFFNDFMRRYEKPFHLKGIVEKMLKEEAPSKPLRSQEQEQEQEQDITVSTPSAHADGNGEAKQTASIVAGPGTSARHTGTTPDAAAPEANAVRTKRGRGNGGIPASPEHAALRTYFCDRWKARFGPANYAWKYGKDDAHVKWILDQVGRDMPQAQKVVRAFIADNDNWLTERGHTISLLVSRFNQYRATRVVENEPDPETGFVRRVLSEAELRELAGQEPLPPTGEVA